MRISTLIGIILGLASIFGAFYLEKGNISKLFLLPPMMIVVGGTLMAGLASSSWNTFKKMPKLIMICFFPNNYKKQQIIFQMLEFSLLTRKSGMLSLEEKINSMHHPYMKKLFQVGIDGADTEALEEIFDKELQGITNRHNENISFFHKLGGLSPTMGIIGTVMGLITTMGEASNGDANTLIASIGVAFLATLWGITLANIIWIPIADKLQVIHDQEIDVLNLIFEGVKCVLLGETPTVIASKLISYFPLTEQDKFQKETKRFIEQNRK